MCGIIYAKSFTGKPVNRQVLEQFQDQISRGTEGFGVAKLEINPETKEEQIVVDRATQENKFLFDLHPTLNASTMILAHHRTPTSTPNATHQTHPILVTHELLKYDYLIAHNGVIWNATKRQEFHVEFFKQLADKYLIETVLEWQDKDARIHELLRFKAIPEEWFNENDEIDMSKIVEDKLWDCETLGYYYQTMLTDGKFNDSEALAVDLALYGEELIDKVEAEGNAAYMGYKMEKGTNKPLSFFFGRNDGNPLNYARNQFGILVSSEGIGNLVAKDTITKIDLTDPKLKQHTYKLEIPSFRYTQTPSPRVNYAQDIEAEERELARAGETKREVGFRTEGDQRNKNIHDQADKHFESAEQSSSQVSDEYGTASDDAPEEDSALTELLGQAEISIENKLSEFIDELSTSNDLESARLKVEEMGENMIEWLDKIEMHKDQIIHSIVPNSMPHVIETSPKE